METMDDDAVVVLDEDGSEVTEYAQPNSPLVPLKTNNEIKITEISLEEHELEAANDAKRPELLEYVERPECNGVVCKLCGEVFESKLDWYRHKYQSHIIYPSNSTMVFQCEHCLVYFKTKKGYLTHMATNHTTPISPNQQPKRPSEVVEPRVTIQDLISRTNPDLVITKTDGLHCNPGCKLNAAIAHNDKVIIENSNRLMLPIRPDQAQQIIKPADTRKDPNTYQYKKPAEIRQKLYAAQIQLIKTSDFSIVPIAPLVAVPPKLIKPNEPLKKDASVQILRPPVPRMKEPILPLARPPPPMDKNTKDQNPEFLKPAILRNSRDQRPAELHAKDPSLQIFRPADLCTVVDQSPPIGPEKNGHITIVNDNIIHKTSLDTSISTNAGDVKSNGLPRIEISQQQLIRAVDQRPRVPEIRPKPMLESKNKALNPGKYRDLRKEAPKDEAEKKKDEKMINDIIQRVRKECEQKGIEGNEPARRHSYRRTTVT